MNRVNSFDGGKVGGSGQANKVTGTTDKKIKGAKLFHSQSGISISGIQPEVESDKSNLSEYSTCFPNKQEGSDTSYSFNKESFILNDLGVGKFTQSELIPSDSPLDQARKQSITAGEGRSLLRSESSDALQRKQLQEANLEQLVSKVTSLRKQFKPTEYKNLGEHILWADLRFWPLVNQHLYKVSGAMLNQPEVIWPPLPFKNPPPLRYDPHNVHIYYGLNDVELEIQLRKEAVQQIEHELAPLLANLEYQVNILKDADAMLIFEFYVQYQSDLRAIQEYARELGHEVTERLRCLIKDKSNWSNIYNDVAYIEHRLAFNVGQLALEHLQEEECAGPLPQLQQLLKRLQSVYDEANCQLKKNKNLQVKALSHERQFNRKGMKLIQEKFCSELDNSIKTIKLGHRILIPYLEPKASVKSKAVSAASGEIYLDPNDFIPDNNELPLNINDSGYSNSQISQPKIKNNDYYDNFAGNGWDNWKEDVAPNLLLSESEVRQLKEFHDKRSALDAKIIRDSFPSWREPQREPSNNCVDEETRLKSVFKSYHESALRIENEVLTEKQKWYLTDMRSLQIDKMKPHSGIKSAPLDSRTRANLLAREEEDAKREAKSREFWNHRFAQYKLTHESLLKQDRINRGELSEGEILNQSQSSNNSSMLSNSDIEQNLQLIKINSTPNKAHSDEKSKVKVSKLKSLINSTIGLFKPKNKSSFYKSVVESSEPNSEEKNKNNSFN